MHAVMIDMIETRTYIGSESTSSDDQPEPASPR